MKPHFAFVLAIAAAIFITSMHDVSAADTAYRFTGLTSKDGLSYNAVKCMMQDSRGYIWIGTYKGLNRYDGTRIKNYGRQELGVSSDYINALSEDSAGNILIGTDNGIVIYDYRKDSFRQPAGAGLLDDRVYDIQKDSKGVSWIGSRAQGLFRYDPATEEISRIDARNPDGEAVRDIYRIAVDRNDRMYAAVYCDDIYQISENGVMRRLETSGKPGYFGKDDIEGIALSPKSNSLMFIASKRHGLCEFNIRTGDVLVLTTLPTDSRPVGLSESGNVLWMSTTSGLVRYQTDDKGLTVLRHNGADRFSLSEDYTTTALPASDGSLFVGTASQGVNYHNPDQDLFQKFYRTIDGISLKGSTVCSFAQDGNGTVWVATKGDGLLTFNPSSGTLKACNGVKGLPERINALCADGDHLWIGYHKGICRLDTRTGKVRSYPHFLVSDMDIDNRVLYIFRSSDGEIFLCTSVGVMEYDRSGDRFDKVKCLGDRAIEYMVEDKDGTVWVASYSQGVYAYDRFNDSVTGHWQDGSVSEMVSSMCLDRDGGIWAIGFSSGFFRYDPSSGGFKPYNKENISTLPTEIFFSAQADGYGNLWLGSDKGLVKYNDRNCSLKIFNSSSGLVDDFLNKSSITLGDGRMLFGSTDGFIMFDPSDFQTRGGNPDVAITDLVIGDKVVVPSRNEAISENIDVTDAVRLKPGDNSFGLKFSVPSSDFLTGDRILCRLKGYEDQWRDISAGMEVFYYNVPAGKYSFQTVTSDSSGERVTAHKDILVELRPPFWQSSEGIFIIALAVVLAAAAVILLIIKRQEARHRKLQEETEQKREKELLEEKMTFFSNVIHEIKTPLTLIRTPLQNILSYEKSPSVMDDLRIIRNSTDYLDKLVRELLDFVKVEQHGYVLDRRNIDIIDRINYTCYNFSETAKDRNLRLKFGHEQDHIVLAADDKALTKIFNNLIHNAIKYAESFIDINAGIDGGDVVVTFRNDGPPIPQARRAEIFKPFIQFSSERAEYSQSFGIGLPLARTLAELHGGSLTLSDKDETEFVLRLPMRTAAENVIPQTKENSNANPSQPLLLLVEDNAELQTYLKRKLKSDYRILASSSAEKALELLKDNKVDLILTDIALQGMSGVELCGKISSDFETSHIPIIVLSAISSESTKIKCMERGAALYIEKPFTLDYLEACVKSVLEKRRRLKEVWQENAPSADAGSFNLVERDAEFLNKLNKEINERMSDPSFTVQNIEEALFMSRSSLTRKIRGLLDTSPVEYLRSRRLAAAAEMLSGGKHRVNEVCYAVGFRSPSYFSKCFKDAYGCLPAEYASKTETDSSKNEIN